MSDTGSSIVEIINNTSVPHLEHLSVLDTDLTIRSADGVLFHLPKKYLEVTTGRLALSESSSQDETIDLPETSTILELLFEFLYPARHPGLASTPFETLAPLAEAAEKYKIYAAMNVCQIRMMGVLPKFAEEVMAYAVKHDYPDIMYAAAPLLLEKPLEDVLAEFPPTIAIAWVGSTFGLLIMIYLTSGNKTRYHARWSSCTRSAMLLLPGICKGDRFSTPQRQRQYTGHAAREYDGCRNCAQPIELTINRILVKLVAGISSLKDLSWMGEPGIICCSSLDPAIRELRVFIEKSIRDIPDLSTFV